MTTIPEALQDLQKTVFDRNQREYASEPEYLAISVIEDEIHVTLCAFCMEEGYDEILASIAHQDIACHISSLKLIGPDEGSNGTRHWDISPLVNSASTFTSLKEFSIQRTSPTDHNTSIIGEDYEEDGQISKFLAKCPSLMSLTCPSAPNSDFFEIGSDSLTSLRLDAGYDTQNFIKNLANSSSFPNLRYLEWSDFCSGELKDNVENPTSYDDYVALFKSKAFDKVSMFVLKNPFLSKEELDSLNKIKPELSIKVVTVSSHYVR